MNTMKTSRMGTKVIRYYTITLILCVHIFIIVYITSNSSESLNKSQFSNYFDKPEDFMYMDDYMNLIDDFKPYDEYEYYKDNPLIHFEENMSKYSFDQELLKLDPDEIVKRLVPVPEFSRTDIVLPLPEKVYDNFLRLKEKNYTDDILILTPIQNAENFLFTYASLIISLSYPRHLISIVLGEDGSTDETLVIAGRIVQQLKKEGFKHVHIHEFLFEDELNIEYSKRHMEEIQYQRRRHIAKARNGLVHKFLSNQSWVLWIDSDVNFIPTDLIQQLLYADTDVLVPSCLFKASKFKRVYDKNTWRETPKSLEMQTHMSKDTLVVEGYKPTSRLFLPHLRAEGRIVRIDGVGGCVLFVRARCYIAGLTFPEEIYNHHIETEGLAKMAADMGFKVYGLPFLEVFH